MDITTADTIHNIEPGHNIVERSDDSEASVHLDPVDMNHEQIDKKLSVIIADDAPTENAVPATLMPSLIGKMTNFNGLVVCKGCWAMSDAAHDQPGQTSEFEFKLVKHNEDSLQFPFSGKYHGWFMLKQPQPLKGSVKIEDKEMELTFTGGDNDTNFRILGQGHNKFGSFNLHGTLTQAGDVHLYREYYTLAPLSTPHSKRKQSFSGELDSNGKKKSHSGTKPKVEQQLLAAGGNGAVSATSGLDLSSPPLVRESSGRVRKMSSLMKEYEDTHAPAASSSSSSSGAKSTSTPKHAAAASSSSSASKASSAVAPAASKESSSDRAQRLSGPLKKCGDLLKELSKHPQAVWFLEPVDYVKFNIPEYPNIIKQPMDFRTIRQALEAVRYDSHEAFAEHMRLVFRNAMTFNQMRDNPVHIAAREMSARFEDRFRQLTTQLAMYSNGAAVDSIPELKRQSSTASSHYGGAGRPSLGSKKKPHGGSSSGSKQAAAPGPRPAPVAGYLPVAGDSSSHQIMEMQRMMQAMQEEISALRSAVRENEIVKRLNETKDAAHNPLSFDEKKKLIAQIHKLPAGKMEQVLEIIQAAIPKNENGDADGDIEVPLDALDTFTLRKLQRFIEDNTVRKRPSSSVMASGAPTLQRQNSSASGRGEPTAKKPRKSMPKSASGAALMNAAAGGGGDMGLFDHDELLFSTDCFDEIRGGGAGSSEQADQQQQEQNYSFGSAGADSQQQQQQSYHQQQSLPVAAGGESHSQGHRPRAGSLDEDFEDLLEMRSPETSNHGPPAAAATTFNNIAVSNADAWVTSSAADNSLASGADSTAEDGDGWGAAQQEVLARQAREQEGPQF